MSELEEKTKKSEKSGIQLIARSAAILRTLRDHPNGVSLGQIAANVDLPRSTVQRIIGALQTGRVEIMMADDLAGT